MTSKHQKIQTWDTATKRVEREDTRRGHEYELLRPGDGVIVDLHGDAATCPCHPSKGVEMATQFSHQSPRLLHCLAFKVRLRRRRPHLYAVQTNGCHGF